MYGQAHAHIHAACLTFLIMRTRVHLSQLAALTPHVGNYSCADSEWTTKKQIKRFFSGAGCRLLFGAARHDVRPENTSAAVGCGTKQEYKSRTRINVWRIKFYRRRSLARDVAFCALAGPNARGAAAAFFTTAACVIFLLRLASTSFHSARLPPADRQCDECVA